MVFSAPSFFTFDFYLIKVLINLLCLLHIIPALWRITRQCLWCRLVSRQDNREWQPGDIICHLSPLPNLIIILLWAAACCWSMPLFTGWVACCQKSVFSCFLSLELIVCPSLLWTQLSCLPITDSLCSMLHVACCTNLSLKNLHVYVWSHSLPGRVYMKLSLNVVIT